MRSALLLPPHRKTHEQPETKTYTFSVALKLDADDIDREQLRQEFYNSLRDASLEDPDNDFLPNLSPEIQKLKNITESCAGKIRDFLRRIPLEREEKDSAAFFALKLNLTEFIKNAIDCGASNMEISIIRKKDGLQISLNDDGSDFPDTFFCKEKTVVNYYTSVLEKGKKNKIESDKPKGESLGGSGLGLAICSTFLKKHQGALYISKLPPKIYFFTPLNKNHHNMGNSFNQIRDAFKGDITESEGESLFITETPSTPKLSPQVGNFFKRPSVSTLNSREHKEDEYKKMLWLLSPN